MFNPVNQTNTFEVGTYRPSMSSNPQPTAQHLRDLWVEHLVHAQLKIDQEYARKHPLTVEFQSRKFFAHWLDDRSNKIKE